MQALRRRPFSVKSSFFGRGSSAFAERPPERPTAVWTALLIATICSHLLASTRRRARRASLELFPRPSASTCAARSLGGGSTLGRAVCGLSPRADQAWRSPSGPLDLASRIPSRVAAFGRGRRRRAPQCPLKAHGDFRKASSDGLPCEGEATRAGTMSCSGLGGAAIETQPAIRVRSWTSSASSFDRLSATVVAHLARWQ
jgi:hypothetical protein